MPGSPVFPQAVLTVDAHPQQQPEPHSRGPDSGSGLEPGCLSIGPELVGDAPGRRLKEGLFVISQGGATWPAGPGGPSASGLLAVLPPVSGLG